MDLTVPHQSSVMLSAAKHLCAERERPFAALRVTGFDSSNCQVQVTGFDSSNCQVQVTWFGSSHCRVQFVKIEPCLNL